MAAAGGTGRGEETILSIDGGGIRGVIPAIVLSAIEERTSTPIHGLFDVIAGTSTGGILALGLTCPAASGGARFTAAELVEMYRQEGKAIFPHEFLGRVRQLFGPKYPERGRREVLGKRFEGARLRDALTEVIVTSYDIEGRKPVFFRTTPAKQSPDTHDFAMRDVALATSAAPTYFRPVRLPGLGSTGELVLVDGGVFANNPGMCGFVDKTTAQGRRQGTMMVSLGTGELTRALSYRSAKRWGLIGWGLRILNVVFDGVTEAVEYELGTLLGEDYHRFQVRLTDAEEPMDDAKPPNVRALVELAEKLVRDRREEIDAVCEELLARRARRGG